MGTDLLLLGVGASLSNEPRGQNIQLVTCPVTDVATELSQERHSATSQEWIRRSARALPAHSSWEVPSQRAPCVHVCVCVCVCVRAHAPADDRACLQGILGVCPGAHQIWCRESPIITAIRWSRETSQSKAELGAWGWREESRCRGAASYAACGHRRAPWPLLWGPTSRAWRRGTVAVLCSGVDRNTVGQGEEGGRFSATCPGQGAKDPTCQEKCILKHRITSQSKELDPQTSFPSLQGPKTRASDPCVCFSLASSLCPALHSPFPPSPPCRARCSHRSPFPKQKRLPGNSS